MSDDPKVPEAVVEAQAALVHRNRSAVAMMAGMGFFLLATMVCGALDGPHALAMASIGATIAWALGLAAYMMHHEAAWKRAVDVLAVWDRRQLDRALGPEAPPSPEDPRWPGVRTLLARCRALAGDDAHVLGVLGDVEVRLRGLLDDLATLTAAVDADRALGTDGPAAAARSARLERARSACAATTDQLLEAVRDLHAELAVRDATTAPLVARLETLVARVEADSEVDAVGAPGGERAAPPRGRGRALER